ncbi:MAG: hypothetical protein ACRYGL_19535 [Janthinobacterium lividum]
MIVTALMAVAYLGFPMALERFAGRAAHPPTGEDSRLHARIVAASAVVGLVCVLVSSGITEW